jgi:hypothetical protein
VGTPVGAADDEDDGDDDDGDDDPDADAEGSAAGDGSGDPVQPVIASTAATRPESVRMGPSLHLSWCA